MAIYDFTDYRKYLKAWISAQDKTSRGANGKLARAAGVSSSLISLILKGEKHLSLEQALEISEYLGLTETEADYFFLLVEYGRAGSVKLSKRWKKKMDEHVRRLAHRIDNKTELSDEIKAIYYSSWIYSGLRNLTALPGEHNTISLAQRLGLPPAIVGQAIKFLLETGLCKLEGRRLTYGPGRTHVGPDSPFVYKHHQNWRLRGMQIMEERREEHLFFTSPMSISKAEAAEIHRLLPNFIGQIMGAARASAESEVVYCFNLDWFEY